MTYALQTMRLLVAAFGPLESFKTILTDGDNGQYDMLRTLGPRNNVIPLEVDDQLQRPSHPFPHNGPRSADMSPGVWEVKWEDREDSVTALLVRTSYLFATSWRGSSHVIRPCVASRTSLSVGRIIRPPLRRLRRTDRRPSILPALLHLLFKGDDLMRTTLTVPCLPSHTLLLCSFERHQCTHRPPSHRP